METREFAHGFRDFTPKKREGYTPPERHCNPELEELLSDSRFWSDYFSKITMNGLMGTIEDPEEVGKVIDTYVNWNTHNLHALTKKVRAAVHLDPKNGIYLNELNFHAMAISTSDEWRMLVDPTYTRSEETIEDEQAYLAITAANYIQDRRKIEKFTDPGNAQLVNSINGQITEIDTMIILLQIAKENENGRFIAIPAPPRFESTRPSKASDMLFIDREEGHARGIQAKTYISNNPIDEYSDRTVYDRYNPRYVTLIDGVADLGNSKVGRVSGKSTTYQAASPGLVSLDFLESKPLKELPGYEVPAQRADLMHAKGIATELSRTRKSFIAHATKNVSAKLSTDIYK